MTDQEVIDRARRDRARQLDELIAIFAGSLGTIVTGFGVEIRGLIQSDLSHVSDLQILSYIQTRLSYFWANSGYSALITAALADYLEAVTLAGDMAALLGIGEGVSPAFGIRALQQIDGSRFDRLGEQAIASIAESTAAGLLTDQTVSDLIDGAERHLATFETNANQVFDTGIIAADRYALWTRFSSAIEQWRYDGPQDLKTRPFCRVHAGVIHTTDEWKAMQNDMSDPAYSQVWMSCGGVNCRHYLTPIVP